MSDNTTNNKMISCIHKRTNGFGDIFVITRDNVDASIRFGEYFCPEPTSVREIWPSLLISDDEIQEIIHNTFSELTPYNEQVDEFLFTENMDEFNWHIYTFIQYMNALNSGGPN